MFIGKCINKYKLNHKNIKYLLWIDDIRDIPDKYKELYNCCIARDYEDAISKLSKFTFDIICLDHDLGEEKTGYDICKYIIENKIKCKEYRIHTSNPVGRDNMYAILNRYTSANIIIN